MKTKTILTICLLGMFAPYTSAQMNYTTSNNVIYIRAIEENKPLPLHVKTNSDESENGEPDQRTLIPEVTLQGNTLRFITPCYGCTLRLVQDGDICYDVEIIGNTLNIPTTFTGIYELQIISGDTIFYTEVEL